MTGGETGRRPTAAELFAGVGGFHLALDRAGFDVVWSNQWEPATKAQHAFDCYERHVDNGDFQTYGRGAARHRDAGRPTSVSTGHVAVNEDIAKVLDQYEAELRRSKRRAVFQTVPDVDLLVGGFPCQDYSVAKTLARRTGSSARRACCGGRSTGSFG